jgi:hypothetical protein
MTFPLTVNRVMGLCAFEVNERPAQSRDTSEKREIARQFHRQMEEMFSDRLPSVYAAIGHEAERLHLDLRDQHVLDEDDLEVTIIQGGGRDGSEAPLFRPPPPPGDPEPPRDPIIGLFQSRRFTARIGETTWDLRVRPSVTACILERDDQLSKLWWTFEGVPVDPVNPPDEDDAVRFINATTVLAETGLPPLRAAYTETLRSVTGKERGKPRMAKSQLRVSLADSTDPNFSRLVDAMHLTDVLFEEAAHTETGSLRAGADEVVGFIRKASGGHRPKADDITLQTGSPGLAAVFSRPFRDHNSSPQTRKFVIAGLASSIGMISSKLPIDPEWTRRTTTPDMVRSASAARPLSARLADQGARELDQFARTGTSPT